MEKEPDRRKRKTREAIFKALTDLLTRKRFSRITVGEIIEKADIGRATFYSHFATKDLLLKELCGELFCHVFDAAEEKNGHHRHIFNCEGSTPAILHLLCHLERDDNRILALLASENNELFWGYFKENLLELVKRERNLFEYRRPKTVPDAYWYHHVAATLSETIRWWIDSGKKESPETLCEYFFAVV